MNFAEIEQQVLADSRTVTRAWADLIGTDVDRVWSTLEPVMVADAASTSRPSELVGIAIPLPWRDPSWAWLCVYSLMCLEAITKADPAVRLVDVEFWVEWRKPETAEVFW